MSPNIRALNHRLVSIVSVLVLLSSHLVSCKKLNESTTIGDDVIPGVDGVTTFDTSITVSTNTFLFDGLTDSLQPNRFEEHILGYISNDPLFGKTSASIFMELKPASFPFAFANKPDSLSIDSVVLVLAYNNLYGDSTIPQRVNVFEIDQSNIFKSDSAYQVRQQYFTYSNFLGSKIFTPSSLNDSVKVYLDTTTNQLRIRLNDAFGSRLLSYDSTNVYKTDSAFKTNFRGFAIVPDEGFGGNALMSFILANNVNTKLAIYYRYMKNQQEDTTVNYFLFTGTTTNSISAQHNYIKRDWSGTPLLAAAGGPPDDLVYLQNAPGSYARIEMPDLRTVSNRIVHRAELMVEQVFHPSDLTFPPPLALFLDAYDSSLMAYKTIPYDLIPDQQGTYPFTFGMYPRNQVDGSGNIVKRWRFNISRYVQNVLNGKEKVYDLRLLAHRYVFDKIRLSPFDNSGDYTNVTIAINPTLGFGRVRVGGGNHTAQRMKLRIVYSKI